jgi:hypothetical protein
LSEIIKQIFCLPSIPERLKRLVEIVILTSLMDKIRVFEIDERQMIVTWPKKNLMKVTSPRTEHKVSIYYK